MPSCQLLGKLLEALLLGDGNNVKELGEVFLADVELATVSNRRELSCLDAALDGRNRAEGAFRCLLDGEEVPGVGREIDLHRQYLSDTDGGLEP